MNTNAFEYHLAAAREPNHIEAIAFVQVSDSSTSTKDRLSGCSKTVPLFSQSVDECIRKSLHVDEDGEAEEDDNHGRRAGGRGQAAPRLHGVGLMSGTASWPDSGSGGFAGGMAADSFAALIAEMTVGQMLGGVATAIVPDGDVAAAELQEVLVEKITAHGDSMVLGRLKIGMATKEFSKPDRTFKDRTWAFTNLAA